MKLFSRNGLAAAATALALSTTALVAPALADEPVNAAVETTEATPSTEPTVSTKVTTVTVSPTQESGSSGSSEDTDPGDVKDWIGVITAVIGALSAVFVFMDKYIIDN